MTWVVDASFTASLFLPDENTETSDSFFDTVSDKNPVYIPHLWWCEMSNVLVTAVRRKRLLAQQSRETLIWMEQLPLIVTEIISYHSLLDLATAHQLSAYDASYLELALEQKAGLASYDRALNKAAHSLGIEVI